jgi:hypothetical protein
MLATLAALVLAAGGPRLESSLAVGGGYETNVNHVDAAALQVGAAVVTVRASGGVALDLGESTGLYAGLRLDGDHYPELSDLTTGTVGAEASLVRELGERWALVLAPFASRGWSGDGARDVTGVGGQLTVRVKPVRALALRAFYGHTSRDAEDPVFSSERDRAGASVEWRARERVYLSLGYAAERGDEVTYRPVSGAVAMSRMGRGPVESFGTAQEAYRALAVSHVAAPSVEVGLGGAVHLRASYELRWVHMWGDAADFRTHAVFAGVGVRR